MTSTDELEMTPSQEALFNEVLDYIEDDLGEELFWEAFKDFEDPVFNQVKAGNEEDPFQIYQSPSVQSVLSLYQD